VRPHRKPQVGLSDRPNQYVLPGSWVRSGFTRDCEGGISCNIWMVCKRSRGTDVVASSQQLSGIKIVGGSSRLCSGERVSREGHTSSRHARTGWTGHLRSTLTPYSIHQQDGIIMAQESLLLCCYHWTAMLSASPHFKIQVQVQSPGRPATSSMSNGWPVQSHGFVQVPSPDCSCEKTGHFKRYRYRCCVPGREPFTA